MTFSSPQKLACTPQQRDILAIARQMGLDGTFLKIGTFGGHLAVEIMNICNPQKLYCLDPYESYEEFRDAVRQEQLADIFAEARERLASFGERVEFVRMYSEHAAKNFADDALDFVYIGGTGKYEYVLKDFQCWYPKIRQGGIIAANTGVEDEGVVRAASDFAESAGAKLYQIGLQCVIFKGRDIVAASNKAHIPG